MARKLLIVYDISLASAMEQQNPQQERAEQGATGIATTGHGEAKRIMNEEMGVSEMKEGKIWKIPSGSAGEDGEIFEQRKVNKT